MSVFVDTSALMALLDEDDPHHRDASAVLRALSDATDLVTSNYVVVESIALVRRRLDAAAEARLVDDLLPVLRVIWVDDATHRSGMATYGAAGRSASLVDHVSFAIMRNGSINEALAFDADFDREGFQSPKVYDVQRRHTLSETRAPYGTPSESADLVSVAELAARSGRSVNTIQSWRRRHADFPSPSVELAAGPIWLWGDVSAWIQQRPHRTSAAGGR